jgi:hypothetical protein
MGRLARLMCLLFAASGAIIGCGGTGPTSIMVLSAAATNTQAAKTARVSFSFTVQGQTFQTAGIADFATSRGTYTTKVPGVGSIEGIQNGTTIFEKLPSQVATLAGKPWIKFDLATGLQKVTGIDSRIFSPGTVNSDPTSALDYLRGASRDVHKVGSDTLHGAQTTEYRGTVDLRLAAAKTPNAIRKRGLQQIAKFLGLNTFAVDVWIDSDGRLRQMRYSLDTSKFHLPTGVPKPTGIAAYTFEFYDFGASYTPPSLPTPDQVIDITHALSQGGPLLASTPPSSGVALSEAIISPPTGFQISTSSDLPNGPIDRAQFAKLLGSKTPVERFHFVTGFSQHSYNPTASARLEVTLLQFASPTAAATFDEAVFTGLTQNRMIATRATGLPASVELNSKETDPIGSYEHLVVARKQNRVVIVDFFNALQERAPLVKTIAQQVYGRL